MGWLAHLPWRQRPKMFGWQQAQALGLRIKEAPAEKAPGLRRSRQDALLTRVKGCSLAVGAVYQGETALASVDVPQLQGPIARSRQHRGAVRAKAASLHPVGMAKRHGQFFAMPGRERLCRGMGQRASARTIVRQSGRV